MHHRAAIVYRRFCRKAPGSLSIFKIYGKQTEIFLAVEVHRRLLYYLVDKEIDLISSN